MPPDPPQGRVLPILRPGVKLSCPPVQNLNEPPVVKDDFIFKLGGLGS